MKGDRTEQRILDKILTSNRDPLDELGVRVLEGKNDRQENALDP